MPTALLLASVSLLALVVRACPATATQRLRARVRYDGANFHGVQKNVRTQDGTQLRTILGTLEQSLWPALDRRVAFGVAGRTDAGVSASGQVVSFDAEVAHEHIKVNGAAVHVASLADALNACLPPDLQLTEVCVVPKSFDVVRHCKFKRYRYRLPPARPAENDESGVKLLKMVASHAARAARLRAAGQGDGAAEHAQGQASARRRRRKRGSPELAITDVKAMARAAAMLEGTHDFGAFQAARGDQKGSVRTVFRCTVEQRAEGGQGEDGGYDVVIEGDGFLYKMVRIIAGTLLMVGMGLASPTTVVTALCLDASSAADGGPLDPHAVPKEQFRRRGVVGPTLPPERLCLEHVEYDCDHGAAERKERL